MLLNTHSPKEEEPAGSQIPLKPHQLAMLRRCREIEERDLGYGIMADKPGAGKTFVILSLILRDADPGTNILVVPHNIYTQWLGALKSFSPTMTYSTYTEYEDITELYFTRSIPPCDVIITTSLYYNIVADSLHAANQSVKRVFLDEVDSIDSIVTKKIDCKTMWLVSASYSTACVENIARHVNVADNEEAATCLCEESFVDSSFGLDSPKTHNYICKSSFLDMMLRNILDDKEMRAAYASDFSLIARNTYKNVARTEKEAVLFLLKDLMMTIDSETNKLQDYLKKGSSISEIERVSKVECEVVIAECEGKLDELHSRITMHQLCVGCMDTLAVTETQHITSCCSNTLCSSCIDTWYNHTLYCPYCRGKVERDTHTLVEPSADTNMPDVSTTDYISHDKLHLVSRLLSNDCGDKVLVFSDYDKVFTDIQHIFRANGVCFLELNGGNVASMDSILSAYKNDKVRVLMINSSFYGCGMNLENTTDVVFYHKTARAMYSQVIGRAQRPGRTQRLNIHNLLYLNE